ncbi:MAG: hypothetical protein IRZ20_06425 [Thermoleophilia bacterium]|nr:hypothetical protein [Thermoleophilia bacterium]
MVTTVGSAGSTQSQTPVNPGSVLGKDDFLKLLVAQLQHQDPLSPTDNAAFMQQMTAFSTVEQLTNLNASVEALRSESRLSQAVSLLGRSIDYVDASGAVRNGTAASVTVAGDGSVAIHVGSDTIGLGAVRGVS